MQFILWGLKSTFSTSMDVFVGDVVHLCQIQYGCSYTKESEKSVVKFAKLKQLENQFRARKH